MSGEKMQILKMLESGKISADEAARLLQTVDSGGAAPQTRSSPPRSDGSQQSNQSQRGNQPREIGGSTGLDDFAIDLRRKFETLAKDMEPKLQRLVGTVAEKTADVADRISKNISDAEARTHHAPSTGNAQHRHAAPALLKSGAMPRDFDLKVEPGYNELNMVALNGDLSVTGYNGDKLTVKVCAKESRAGARLELLRLGSRYFLSYDEGDFKTLSVDALVPEKLFASLVVGASGGRTGVANITTEHFTVQSCNGAAAFRGIRAENIKIETSNGRLTLDEISAKNANIEGSGGAIDANYLDAANLRLFAANGGLTLNAGDFRQGADYTWVIEASNGKVALNVPLSPQNGYHIKASTSLGKVRLGLPALNYLSNAPNSVEAVSAGYDNAAVRVRISAETSNAELSVN
jgi:hypothetical protein